MNYHNFKAHTGLAAPGTCNECPMPASDPIHQGGRAECDRLRAELDAERRLKGELLAALRDLADDLRGRQDEGANFNPGLLTLLERAEAAIGQRGTKVTDEYSQIRAQAMEHLMLAEMATAHAAAVDTQTLRCWLRS